MPEDENFPEPSEVKEFVGRSGESGSEYYHRGTDSKGVYGSADKLQALADGFYGMNWVFGINIAIFAASKIGSAFVVGTDIKKIDPTLELNYFLVTVVLLFIATSCTSFSRCKQIGVGRDWSPIGAYLASFLVGVNSVFCCGAVGYLVMPQVAASEMKKYGIFTPPTGSLKIQFIRAKVNELRRLEASQTSSI